MQKLPTIIRLPLGSPRAAWRLEPRLVAKSRAEPANSLAATGHLRRHARRLRRSQPQPRQPGKQDRQGEAHYRRQPGPPLCRPAKARRSTRLSRTCWTHSPMVARSTKLGQSAADVVQTRLAEAQQDTKFPPEQKEALVTRWRRIAVQIDAVVANSRDHPHGSRPTKLQLLQTKADSSIRWKSCVRPRAVFDAIADVADQRQSVSQRRVAMSC